MGQRNHANTKRKRKKAYHKRRKIRLREAIAALKKR